MANIKVQGSEVTFFCRACLIDKPLSEQSYDPRFCNFCYAVLLAEAPEPYGSKGGGPWWIPKRPPLAVPLPPPKPQPILSTVRGRRQLPLSVDLINFVHQLDAEGLGGRRIADRLKTDLEVSVSYKTIHRILAGKRIQRQPPLPI